MRIQHADEQKRVKELEARVEEMESALAHLTLDKIMYQATWWRWPNGSKGWT